jgi:hypothetical protein
VRAQVETYPGQVLDLNSIDLEEIANALADQTDYEHHCLISCSGIQIGCCPDLRGSRGGALS